MALDKNRLRSSPGILEGELRYEDEIVLTYKIYYPIFRSVLYPRSVMEINRFYKLQALSYLQYVQEELYPQAVEGYRFAVQNNYPVMVYEVLTEYHITYQQGCILSLYFDRYTFTGGAHGSTLRYSQTWNLRGAKQIPLSSLFLSDRFYKRRIFQQIRAQIQKEPEIYFEDYEKLMVKTFNENSFYCTPQGVVIYYQQYDIAPYASGIREFLLPYSLSPRDPVYLCRTPSPH